MGTHRAVWAEINLKALENNIAEIKKKVGKDKKIMAIVKANAYGHGDLMISEVCEKNGIDSFAVATLEEGVGLRKGGIKGPILVLGWSLESDYRLAIENNIALTIFDLEEAMLLNEVAREVNKKAKIHLKIDTGMGRIGIVASEENIEEAKRIISLSFIELEGVYTHFSKADELDKSYSKMQLERFLKFTEILEEESSIKIPLKHAANSAAILDFPESHLDMVRAGIILYGLKPSDEVNMQNIDLKPVFNLKAKISRVAKFPKGTKISYGGTFTTRRETLIATLPIGYADGYARRLSNKGEVLVKGKKCLVVGNICMDQLMIDVTDVPEIKKGDEATLIGSEQGLSISADDLALKLETINYEVLTVLSTRIPRRYPSFSDNL